MPHWNPFKKEKQQPQEDQYEPPPGPPPSYVQQHQTPGYVPPPSGSGYIPPPGPPPSHNPNNPFVDYTKKSDQPHADPSHQPEPAYYSTYQRLPQPPLPTPGAPASSSPSAAEPPPYHDWTVVPDTALLPPPPPMNNDFSPTANASAEAGAAAFEWCNANPLRAPLALSPAQLSALAFGRVTFVPFDRQTYKGELLPHDASPGRYRGRTASGCGDACLWTALPLYSAAAHSPSVTANAGRPKTVYFELRVAGVGGMPGAGNSKNTSLEEADAGIALGFVAQPYPAWRLPGWQRGSLGVHGDDGRRYVNDTFGGVDFTTAFAQGDTVGLGMTFGLPRNGPPPQYGQQQQQQRRPGKCDVQVFFTRNGKRAGGWDLHEELDERAIGGVEGLEGDFDVHGAVGVFGGVEFAVFFNQADWMYRPEHV
ncbi:spry domain-containing protein [Diplodia corticola]|uniref:Spry domain-containing protein n=1 Tax=Diplodia corticola TaxID=236234 RepID=A0A1J9R5G7_9PEZI|nr:spry domain-containing protein [Diplodia corticola]OJD35848.1 spry domain-containing protein [Diplodia corticola]